MGEQNRNKKSSRDALASDFSKDRGVKSRIVK